MVGLLVCHRDERDSMMWVSHDAGRVVIALTRPAPVADWCVARDVVEALGGGEMEV